MAIQLYPAWPPKVSNEQLQYLVSSINEWSITHGLAIRPPPSLVSAELDQRHTLAITAPVTLFPSPFPRSCFQEGLDIQKAYNELYAAVAADEHWLGGLVEE